jgi:hypothetical protein
VHQTSSVGLVAVGEGGVDVEGKPVLSSRPFQRTDKWS